MTSSQHTLRFNLPTILTLSRIVVIPLFIYVAPRDNFLGALIFALASITDFLDGYLARRSGEVTKFGIIIDPIADKFLVIAALIVLVDMGRVDVVSAVIIVVREFLVTALRVVALARAVLIPAEMGGKLKVGAQITAVLCILLGAGPLGVPPMDAFVRFLGEGLMIDVYLAGHVALWVSVVLGVTSGVRYMIGFWRTLSSGGTEGA